MQNKSANIYQRLNAVRRNVGYLQKDKSVGQYMVITHDMVTAAVREPFINHAVIVVPSLVSSKVSATMNDKFIRYEGLYRIAFVNAENPDDSVEFDVESHALDHGDKAPGKALSYAVKYAILKVLSIETGEDEESRVELVPEVVTRKQAETLKELVSKTGSNAERFLEYAKSADFFSIPAHKYDTLEQVLLSRT